MKDGDSLDFPGMRLQVLETPGHTIESISVLVFDLKKDQVKPYAVLTGDTLFIGDVGRPDLRASLGWTANDLGAHLYDSLHSKLLALPDETLVYPAHGSGSLCGKNLSSDTVSTLGIQRRMNYALQPMMKEEFIRVVTADQPDAPPYFTYDAILNTRERTSLDKNLEQVLHPLELDEVLRMGDAGAQILDVREPAEYAKDHLAGSINIGLGGQYATWAGTVLDRTKPIIIIAEPGREQEAALRLGRIGFDLIKGYPMAQVTPASLTFGSQNLGTTSAPQPVTLTNTGGSVLILSGMVGGGFVGGGFPFINSDVSLKCASNIAAGSSCTFNVTFSPMVDGPVTGTWTFVDNSGGVLGSTQSVSLTGTGTGTAPPPPSPSPLAELLLGAPLQFPSVLVKSTGNPQAVTLHNVGNAALAVSSITASSNFTETNNCGSSVPAGGSCTINVALAPLVGGLLSGNLTVVDNSNNQAGSVQSVSMSGWGEDFTLAPASGSSSSATAAPGQTATYTLSLGDTGVFNDSVALTCTGAPAESACTVSPNPAARRSNITVSVSTTAPSAVAPWAIPPVWPHLPLSRTVLMLAALLAGASWAVWGWKESGARRRRTLLLPLAAGLLLILLMAACGGGGNRTSNAGTPAGTYVLTVTGTAGSGSTALSHNVTLTLTVR
jgi:rhodanese-related sulfurtransferase